MNPIPELDSVDRFHYLASLLKKKLSLNLLYREVYSRYAECLNRCPRDGLAVEIGSGAGFVKEILPSVITTDVLPYPGLCQVVDATHMPFDDNSVKVFFLNNVLHHIPNVELFFSEVNRTLTPGGRVLIEDHNHGWLSHLVLKYIHHEPYNPEASDWKFASSGPLSGANTALAWIVFTRDREKFLTLFPQLKIVRQTPHTPLRYWLTGGLKKWSLLPRGLFSAASAFDHFLTKLHPLNGCFITIEIEKIP